MRGPFTRAAVDEIRNKMRSHRMSQVLEFLAGGGSTGALMRAHDAHSRDGVESRAQGDSRHPSRRGARRAGQRAGVEAAASMDDGECSRRT
jgi:hypothetical protein